MIIFSTSLKRIFKNKIRFILMILCPFIFIAMFSMQNHKAATIGIVDYDHSIVSKELSKVLKNIEGIKVLEISEDQIYDMTASYVVDYSIIIGSGFENEILSGNSPKLKEYYVEDRQKLFFVKSSINTEIENYKLLSQAANFDRAKFENSLAEYRESKLTVSTNVDALNKIEKSRAAFGFLIQFMMYMAIITTGTILEDKTNGTFYRIFYGPISIKRYMAENLAAFFTTGIIQAIGIIAALVLIFRMYLGSAPAAIIGLFIIFAFVCVTMGLFIISVLKKPLQAYIAVAVVTTPLIMLGGCYWSFSLMPDILNRIGRFFPISWVMRTVDAVLAGSITGNVLLTNYAVLLLFALVFLIVGLVKKVDISK